MSTSGETERIRERYRRRAAAVDPERYGPRDPAALMWAQERERALVRWIRTCRIAPLSEKRVLEIGCGSGRNLLDLLRLGFRPENLAGNELLAERIEAARALLPAGVRLLLGDALELRLPPGSFDVVLQFTVFTSILDIEFQNGLAARMWEWAAPGGGILWYDFTYDNPRNPDVRGIPLRRVRQLFPEGTMISWRLTLAPPLSRLVTRIHPSLYGLFNAVPALRTHVLCWIRKR